MNEFKLEVYDDHCDSSSPNNTRAQMTLRDSAVKFDDRLQALSFFQNVLRSFGQIEVSENEIKLKIDSKKKFSRSRGLFWNQIDSLIVQVNEAGNVSHSIRLKEIGRKTKIFTHIAAIIAGPISFFWLKQDIGLALTLPFLIELILIGGKYFGHYSVDFCLK